MTTREEQQAAVKRIIGIFRKATAASITEQQAASQGVPVCFEEYRMMPHIFATMLPSIAQSRRCMSSWAEAVRKCAMKEANGTSATLVEPGELEVRELNPLQLVDFTVAEAHAMMQAKQRTLRVWEGPSQAKALL